MVNPDLEPEAADGSCICCSDLRIFFFFISVFPVLFAGFCFLTRITYFQSVCYCFVVNTQPVRHADGQFSTPTHGCEYLLQFDVCRLKDLDNTLGNLVGIKPSVKLGILRGYAPRAFAGIAEVAAVHIHLRGSSRLPA